MIASNGQVKLGGLVFLEHSARETFRLVRGQGSCGFAGSDGKSQALQEASEAHFGSHVGNRPRIAVSFARDKRTDRMLRQIDAEMESSERERLLFVVGDGNAIEPEDGVTGIGSVGPFAWAAEQAMVRQTDLEPARETFRIGVLTSERISMETVE